MKTIGNLIWVIFGGAITAFIWCVYGVLWCCTIIGIPLGKQCFKFASLSFMPFNKEVKETNSGAISTIAQWGMFLGGGRDENGESRNPIATILVMILAPLAAMLIQMGISRSREYMADKSGGEMCGNPDALADALLKIEAYAKRRVMPGATEATAHMFIINPFSGIDAKKLFSTHPTTAERVKLLREQAEQMRKNKRGK